MSSIYLTLMLFVNECCGQVWTSLTQRLQEDITERNLGKALAFPLPENDAVRVFGVPRNVFLDVGHFHAISFLT
jgi:hypothetical protein